MTNDDLCRLALAAIDDADARVVLADAIIEAGWWDERVSSEALGGWSRKVTYSVLSTWDINGYSDRARAIAAVLLFGEWPTSWPLAERCWRASPAEQFNEVIRLAGAGIITTEQALGIFEAGFDD